MGVGVGVGVGLGLGKQERPASSHTCVGLGLGFGPTPTLTLALTLTLTLTLTNPNPNQERAPCCSACGNSSKKLVSTCHNGARRAVGEGGGATRHAPAQPGTRRHAPSRAVTRRHGLSGSRCAAAPRVRQRVCAAAHPLELGDGDAFDGRRRQVRVVHRPRRHGRDRSSVGPVRTTGYCAAQRSQHACACTVACVQMQMCVCARTDVCVCVCAYARARACVCRCARRAAPMYLPTWPQMVHFTPCTWQWPHTSQIGSRSRFGPLMAGGPLARRAAGERATLVDAAVCRRADPDDARR